MATLTNTRPNIHAATAEEARAIAKEIFLWGMHPIAIYHMRYNQAQNEKSPVYSGVNRLFWYRRPMKALPKVGTTPNATTLYGFAMLDFSKEPVVIIVNEVKEHYWSVQLHDNYAHWWHMIGSQFNPQGPVRRLLLGRSWKGSIPADFVGADIVESRSDFGGAVARVALRDDIPEELRAVNAIQDSVTVMPLSQWIAAGKKTVKAEDVPVTKGNYPSYPGMETVRVPGHLQGLDFLRWASLVLNDPVFTKQADSHQELVAFTRFERLGLKTGSSFDPSVFPPEIVKAIESGIEDGRNEVKALIAKESEINRNGWGLFTDLGYQDTDWLDRARYGYIAVLGPVPSRSHTAAFCLKDSDGLPLSGRNKYTITFDLNDMPPVTEFWEMPLYDTEGYFHDNPIDRYSVNSYMLERGKLLTADRKLILYVQNEEPKDTDQRKNWLPAPKGGFQFTARFYGPHGPLIDWSYNMPGVVRSK